MFLLQVSFLSEIGMGGGGGGSRRGGTRGVGGGGGLRNKKNEDGRSDIFEKVFEESEIRFYKRLREVGESSVVRIAPR